MTKINQNGMIKALARDAITYMQKQTNYGKAAMKIVFVRLQNELKPYWGTIEIFHKSEGTNVQEKRIDYGSIVLVSYIFSSDDILNFLKSITESQTIALPDGINLKFEDYGEFMFLYGNEEYGYVQKHSWPCNNLQLHFPSINVDHYAKLAKRGLPLYPDPHTAIRDFLELENALASTADSGRYLVIKMPDFRAKITNVTISGNKVKLTLANKDTSYKSLIAKIYMENESASYKSEDLTFDESKTITCQTDFEPTTVNICVLDEYDDIVDARDINLTWFRYASDVRIETPSLQVKELALRGENDKVEFKREFSNDMNRILATITAFANSTGGIILIGVDDDTTICGCNQDVNKLKDSLRDSLNKRIEPPSIDFEVEQIEIGASNSDEEKKSVILVRIQEGNDKPYRFFDKGFLLRRGSSNRPMTRHELDEIYRGKNGNNPSFGHLTPP